MPKQELLDYIQKELEQGKPKEEIEEALLMAGWEIKDVDEALKSFDSPDLSTQSVSENINISPATGVVEHAQAQVTQNTQVASGISSAKKRNSGTSKTLKVILIIIMIMLFLGVAGFFFARGAFDRYIAPIFNSSKVIQEENRDNLLAGAQNPICNYPVNGETIGEDCRFIKDPAQIRYEKTKECGSTLSYSCNGGEYSKYKSACVGKDYYDYSGSVATLNTFLSDGQCVHSGDVCSATICENDARCGGSNQNCVPKSKSPAATLSKNECFDINIGAFPGVDANNFQCEILGQQPIKMTFKEDKFRLDVESQQANVVFLLRNEGVYMSAPGGTFPANSPLAGSDWMFFPGSSYCQQPQGTQQPGVPVSQFDIDAALQQSRENLRCQTFMAQDNFFHHPGKVVNMGDFLCEQVGSIPSGLGFGVNVLDSFREKCQEWSKYEIVNP